MTLKQWNNITLLHKHNGRITEAQTPADKTCTETKTSLFSEFYTWTYASAHTHSHTHTHTRTHTCTAFWSPLSPALWLWFTAQCFSTFWTRVSNQRISCSFPCQNPHSNPSHFVHTVAHAPLRHLSEYMKEREGDSEREKDADRETERDPGSRGNVLSWFPGWLY